MEGSGSNHSEFFLPFSIKCIGCDCVVAKDTSLEATKRKSNLYLVGKFLSTSVVEFSLNCPYCNNRIVIKTDPERCNYSLLLGGFKAVNKM